MTLSEDPFSILGVDRQAPLAEVKRAYRRLAMLWHPDRNPSPAAEREFRRVHAAYELLLDPQRLADWQQTQAAGASARRSEAENVGEDCLQELTLTLEEAARGCRRNIELTHHVRCRSEIHVTRQSGRSTRRADEDDQKTGEGHCAEMRRVRMRHACRVYRVSE